MAALVIAAMPLFAGSCDVRDTEVDKSAKRVEETSSLFKFIPDGKYLSLGFTDIESILGNEWVKRLINLNPDIRIWDEKLGVRIEGFHKIAIALMPPSGDDEDPTALIIMLSDLPEKGILDLLGEKRTYFNKLKVGDKTQYVSGENFSFGFLQENIVALGSPDLVRKAIEMSEGKGSSLLSGKNLKDFERYLGSDDDFWLGISNLSHWIEQIAYRAPIVKNFGKIDFIYFGFKATEGLKSRVIMDCISEKAAGKIARGLSTMVGLMSTLMDFDNSITLSEDELASISVEEMKSLIEDFLKNIDINSKGKQVSINVEMPKKMIDFLIDSMKKVLELEQNQLPDDIDRDGNLKEK